MPSIRDQVFISYSHKDKDWLEKLQTMLRPLVRKQLAVWDDTKIRAGTKWKVEIIGALAVAKVAILLVSPNFLGSDFIAEHELPPLLAAAEKQGLVILWIYLSSCLYDETEIGDYQASHDISKPLDSLTPAEQNAVLVDVCRKIKAAVNQLKESRDRSPTTTEPRERDIRAIQPVGVQENERSEPERRQKAITETLGRSSDHSGVTPVSPPQSAPISTQQNQKTTSPARKEVPWAAIITLLALVIFLAGGTAIYFGLHNESTRKTAESRFPPIRAKIYTFGIPGSGADDQDIKSDETLSLVESDHQNSAVANLFLKEQPRNTTGLMRRLDPSKFYLACRFDKKSMTGYLRSHQVTVTNLSDPARKPVKASVVEWGPPLNPDGSEKIEYKGLAAGLSPGLAYALGLRKGDEAEISFEPN